MHAAVLHALGKPPLFEEFPDPTPGEKEVLIYVWAAALKPVDKQLAGGRHYASPHVLPVICGADSVGRRDGQSLRLCQDWAITANENHLPGATEYGHPFHSENTFPI